MINVVAILYSLICAAVILFQVCLIAGAPWGRLTQGGSHPAALPGPNRVVAGISIFLLTFMAGSILSAADDWPQWPQWLGWAALGVQVISTLLNWITPSRPERLLWAPITTTMLIFAGLVMLS